MSAYNFGQFMYYIHTCGIEDLKKIPYEKGTVEYHNFCVGFDDAFIDQERFALRCGIENPGHLARRYGITDYEAYLPERTE